ncbi:MAG: NADH-quinone oxidoreductase subunit J [Deltaproteobacteria bacterium]|nr:NADH-quinone oxidoreductase subunit J [Deltaproteobacteria bacterium]
MWADILFWVFAAAVIVLALAVITFKNPVNSAMALVADLFFVAALFVLVDAHFLAVIQILLYAGAVMVLFLFVIMLINQGPDELGRARRTFAKAVALILLFPLALVVLRVVENVSKGGGFLKVPSDYGTIEAVGRLVFGQYLLPFEVASVLLLAAIIGAVAIAKRRLW